MKSNFKKCLSVFLAVLMLLGAFPFASFAANPMEIVFATVDSQAGGDVEVAVSLRHNPGISSLKLRVSYDESVLKLTDVVYNERFGGKTMKPAENKSPFTLIWISPFAECDYNETFATLHFSVKSDQCGARAEISATYDPEDIYDFENVNVDSTVLAGEVVVRNHTGGTATCSQKAVCTTCGEEYGDYAPHTEEVLSNEEPSCSKTGLTQGKRCTVCGQITLRQDVIPTLPHTEVADEGYDATCWKTGLTDGSHCSVCGATITPQVSIPMTEHTWVKGQTVEPNCQNRGYTMYTCSECSASEKRDYTDKLPHTEAESPREEPSCTKTGRTAGTYCSVCGETIVGRETIPMVEHQWVEGETKAPTCWRAGYTVYTCSSCGSAEHRNMVTPLPHTEVADPGFEATCTRTGLTDGSHCSVCQATVVEQLVIPKKPHTTSDWITDKEATCMLEGEMYRECTLCKSLLETKRIPKKDHVSVKMDAVAATCSRTGLTEGAECSLCHTVLIPQIETPAIPHTPSDWIIDTDATCIAVGSKHKECTACHEVLETAEIAITGHKPVAVAGRETACTQPGLTTGTKCSVCDAVLEAQASIPALGHSFGEWVVVKKATCEQKGTKTRECSRCQAKETAEIEITHRDDNHDGYCDDCNVNIKQANCKCICHNKCKFVQFIYKIVKFFWKLFRMKRVCACGVAHY